MDRIDQDEVRFDENTARMRGRAALRAELAKVVDQCGLLADAMHSVCSALGVSPEQSNHRDIDAIAAECVAAISSVKAELAAAKAANKDEFMRGWRTALAEVAVSMDCDIRSIYKGQPWADKIIAIQDRLAAATKRAEEAVRISADYSDEIVALRAQVAELEAQKVKQRACKKCRGTGTISESHGISYETDTAAEVALNWHEKKCPECSI
jgi:hypothetical protein